MQRTKRALFDGDWQSYGLCGSEDPRLWDGIRTTSSPTGPLSFDVAREICAVCKVSNICLARALETGDSGCMRGGKDPAELAELIKAGEKPKIERARVMA